MKKEEFQTKEKEQTSIAETFDFENKRIGAYIRAESGKQIDWYLCMLNRFLKDNGIEKVDTYYIEREDEDIEYQRLIIDIFDEDIDALLVAGGAERLYVAPEKIEKMKDSIAVLDVYWN